MESQLVLPQVDLGPIDVILDEPRTRRPERRHTTPSGFKILRDIDLTADPGSRKTTCMNVVIRAYRSVEPDASPEIMLVIANAAKIQRNGTMLNRLNLGGADLDDLAVSVRDINIMELYSVLSSLLSEQLKLDDDWESKFRETSTIGSLREVLLADSSFQRPVRVNTPGELKALMYGD